MKGVICMDYDLFSYWSHGEVRSIDIPDLYTRTKFLLTRDPVDARKAYQELLPQYRFIDMKQFLPAPSLPERLPLFSFLLQFGFKLATPYISKDDDAFYCCDNPVRKEKVFKAPMISGTSWKGNMRWTAGKALESPGSDPDWLAIRLRLVRLFGQENKGEKRYLDSLKSENKDLIAKFERAVALQTSNGSRRGRLHFYPTFFDKIGLEVINPHRRKTKAGTQPIYFETVPAGASGLFSFLYVPFDLLGLRPTEIKAEVVEDLSTIRDSLYAMMYRYGFSAKKGNSFGLAEEKIEGSFEMAGVKLPLKKVAEGRGVNQKIVKESPFAKLQQLKVESKAAHGDVSHFSSFRELKGLLEETEQYVRGREHER